MTLPGEAHARRRQAAQRGRGRGCRHWVGLAIVAIQMAAWCLVGALLMHRGVSNLQRRDALRDEQSTSTTAAHRDGVGDVTGAPASSPSPPASDDPPADVEPPAAGAGAAEEPTASYPEPTVSPKLRQWSFFPHNAPVRPFVSKNSLDIDFRLKDRADDDPPVDILTPRKGVTTGAATAVVMVTVGGVMLVVGPAFLLVKVMDVYQRQRRANKMSRQEDPPPSYDEVTEKAPRYSALFQVSDSGELMPLAGPGAAAETAAEAGDAGECRDQAGPAADTDPNPTAD